LLWLWFSVVPPFSLRAIRRLRRPIILECLTAWVTEVRCDEADPDTTEGNGAEGTTAEIGAVVIATALAAAIGWATGWE
jgi:adenosyl cobinamide kinase/adenosyl cobinamide phosphate guanylyltransferase